MDVTGQSRLALPSTRAIVHVTVEYEQELAAPLPPSTLASNASVAALHALLLLVSQRTASTASAVVAYLHSANLSSVVSHLHTTAAAVQPTYLYRDGQRLQKGYRALLSLSVSVNATAVAAVVDGMLERGVTRVDGVTFEAEDAAVKRARQRAIAMAVEDALMQARVAVRAISSAKGVELDARGLQVVSVHVLGVTVPASTSASAREIFTAGARALRSAAMANLPLLPDERIITASVLMKVRF